MTCKDVGKRKEKEIGSDDNINIWQGRINFQKHEISKKKRHYLMKYLEINS